MLKKAREKDTENLVFELWKSLYPQMMVGRMEFIEFSSFKKTLLTTPIMSTKSGDEIENELDKVIAAYERR